MIAGPNGSGKSSLTQILTGQGIGFGEYLNADDIARELEGPADFVADRAQAEVRRLRQLALDEGRDHSFETVLSHPSHIDHLRRARDAGFTVTVYFVATEDPLINIGRVANRVVHGGHDVPHDRVIARYHRSLGHLALAMSVAHEGAIFDNSSTADPMRLLATLVDGRFRELVPPALAPLWWREIQAAVRAGVAEA